MFSLLYSGRSKSTGYLHVDFNFGITPPPKKKKKKKATAVASSRTAHKITILKSDNKINQDKHRMMQETPDMLAVTAFTNVTETNLHHISPIISFYVSRIIGYINGYVLTIIAGVFGIFTNTANISVYLKMGLSETTNISFFSLSISDLLVSMSAVVVQITYNPPVSLMKLPSGYPVSEIGMAACYIMFPCMGCSA